jgi:hypothetical protein
MFIGMIKKCGLDKSSPYKITDEFHYFLGNSIEKGRLA